MRQQIRAARGVRSANLVTSILVVSGVGSFAIPATSGCVGAENPDHNTIESLLVPDHVDAILLAESTISSRHDIQLYELADGGIAIHERAHEAEATVLRSWDGTGSVLDFLRAKVPSLNIPSSVVESTRNAPPGIAGNQFPYIVPSAMLQGQSHELAIPSPAQDRDQVTSGPAAFVGEHPIDFDTGTVTAHNQDVRAEPDATLEPGPAVALDYDWNADASAWTAAYCTSPADGWNNSIAWFDGIWCPTNWGTAISGYRPTVDFEARGLNASFTVPATHWVEQWTGSTWNRFISYTVQPRYQSLWIFSANQTYRSGIEGERIDFSVRYRRQMPSLGQLNDYPSDFSDWPYSMTNNMQGVAHDCCNWYMTDEMQIAKWNVSTSLQGYPQLIYSMPLEWRSLFNHMGDLVYANGYLYVPLEGPHRGIGVFDTNLNWISYYIMDNLQDHFAWLAYNPKNGLFYSSSEFDTVHTLKKYNIIISGPTMVAEPKGTVTLTGNWAPISSVQGGEFSNKGNLYVSSDVAGGGLYEIDVLTGFVAAKGNVLFSPGFPYYEELEGLTVWDLDSGIAPGVSGQIHLLMVDNDASTDELYFKHYRANPLSNL